MNTVKDCATFGDERLPARFWAKVRELDGGCWEWTAARLRRGYGQVWLDGRNQLAHRAAYAALAGKLPPWQPRGLQLDHLCRNRACVNPAHLELVTNRENVLRGDTFAADQLRRTHCPQGHEYAADNLRPDALSRGQRLCLTCQRECDAAIRAARTALGITRHDYVARFGWSRRIAEDIVARVESGVRPEVILAGDDAAIAATEADLGQTERTPDEP